MDGLLIMAASAQSSDCLQEFARLKSTSYGFGLDSAIEQHLEGWPKAGEEVAGQGTVGRVAGIEPRCQPPLRGDEISETLHPAGKRLEGLMPARELRRRIRALVHLAPVYRHDQVGALREMTVNRPKSDTCPLRDLTNRRIDS